jgi:hypothetical protein
VFFVLKYFSHSLGFLTLLDAAATTATVFAADLGKLRKATILSGNFLSDHLDMLLVDKMIYCKDVQCLKTRGHPEIQICCL